MENFNIDTVKWRLDKLKELWLDATKHKNILRAYTVWHEKGDLRLRIFHHVIITISNANTSSILLLKYLTKNDFWHGQTQLTENDKIIYILEYDKAIFRTYFSDLYIVIENFFRALLRTIDSSVCHNGNGEFKSVYDALFKRVYRFERYKDTRDQFSNIMDLYRLMRNTIHNLYIHYHPRGKDDTINYLGYTFEFKQGQPIDFLGWELLLEMTHNIITELRLLVESPDVIQLDHVVDPYENFIINS